VGKREQKEKQDLKYQAAFGKKLKETREKLGWSQVDLAANSSVSEGQISAIENGHESPRLYTIKSLAVALGKTPSELLDFPYEFKLNTNFKRPKTRKSGTTNLIKKLFAEGFFIAPKSVSDVVVQCKKKFNITLRSAETSGALLLLVNSKSLKKIKSRKNKNLYQNK
jgi:transcriptional regulator with XRE-family HTH domain